MIMGYFSNRTVYAQNAKAKELRQRLKDAEAEITRLNRVQNEAPRRADPEYLAAEKIAGLERALENARLEISRLSDARDMLEVKCNRLSECFRILGAPDH
jgi:predicted RNase H-like nuclease (RuvC/YqgF family)